MSEQGHIIHERRHLTRWRAFNEPIARLSAKEPSIINKWTFEMCHLKVDVSWKLWATRLL